MSSEIKRTERTRVRRIPKRAEYRRAQINAILDEGLVCHLGFSVEGRVFVIPTGYARDGERLLVHGSSASRMMRELSDGIDVCVTVTLLDGLVLARSAFHHSMNYRSVVIFGRAVAVTDPEEKTEALRAFTEHMIRGRWDDVRWPDPNELKATTVLSLPITEASAKVRTGGPIDDAEDHELDAWAGVIPLTVSAGAPVDDELLRGGIDAPEYVRNYGR